IRGRWHTITGLLTSSGDSSSCNRRSASSPKLRSNFHRCKREQASTWKPSRSRSQRPCSRMPASRIRGERMHNPLHHLETSMTTAVLHSQLPLLYELYRYLVAQSYQLCLLQLVASLDVGRRC